MKRWYVAHTRPKNEQRAIINLQRQGFEVYMPRYLTQRRHARRVETVSHPLFPRYIFIWTDPKIDPWRSINSTYGVLNIVAQGDTPQAVPEGIVDSLKSQEDATGIIQPTCNIFHPGQRLEVLHGPMAMHIGYFNRMSDTERVILLLILLGRQVNVTIPCGAVAAA